MSQLVFFRAATPSTLAAIAAEAGARMGEGADPNHPVRGLALLDRAEREDVSAFFDGLDPDDLRATRAGACLVASRDLGSVPPRTLALVTDEPRVALARLAAMLHPQSLRPAAAVDDRGIDPSARVDPTATLEPDVVVDAGAVVGAGVEIGSGTFVGANAVIGAGTRIGRGCSIDALASVCHALIGDRVIVHAGARLGHDTISASGAGRMPHLGRLIVQNDVEIGPNAILPRGAVADTVIGEGARIGALASLAPDSMVARNARVGGG